MGISVRGGGGQLMSPHPPPTTDGAIVRRVTVEGANAKIVIPAQTAVGNYSFLVGPNIEDLTDNLMNQDFDDRFGESTGDRFLVTFAISAPLLASATPTAGAASVDPVQQSDIQAWKTATLRDASQTTQESIRDTGYDSLHFVEACHSLSHFNQCRATEVEHPFIGRAASNFAGRTSIAD